MASLTILRYYTGTRVYIYYKNIKLLHVVKYDDDDDKGTMIC